jgi:hypothetical protein
MKNNLLPDLNAEIEDELRLLTGLVRNSHGFQINHNPHAHA